MSERPRIAYCFADHGVEAEALSTVGEVHRFTINPRENPFCETTTEVDLMAETPVFEERFDLWFGHPKCTKWSDMPGVDPDDHEDQIPRARELAREMAEHYVIENKARAPLDSPVKLTGKMFTLPIKYERAFESSFPVSQPPRQQTLGTESSPFYYPDMAHSWWKNVKGIRGSYPKEHTAKNALPLAYVDHICRDWLKVTGLDDGVGDYTEYDDRMETQRRELANTALDEFGVTEGGE